MSQMADVSPFGSQPSLQSQLLDLCNHGLHIGRAEHHVTPGLDMTYVTSGIGHVVGHVGLERGIAHKHHQRVNGGCRNIQQGFKSFDVLVVLVKWVLKFVGVFVNFLGPGSLVG